MTAADGILAYDLDFTVNGEKLERSVLRDTLSPIAHVNGIAETVLTFKTEIKGAGLTGTQPDEPEIGRLLNGCGFNTGVASGTSRLYSLVSNEADIGSVAFRVYHDQGTVNKALGCRGTVKFILEAGQYGVAEWEFRGTYVAVAAATVPTLTPGSDVPVPLYNSSFQIAGFSPVSSTCEIDLQNEISRRDDLNSTTGVDSFRLTARTPIMNFNADAVAESSNPFWGDWDGAVLATFGINAGTNAGNRVLFSGHFLYEQAPKNTDQDGIRTYDCVAALVTSTPSTSNDELSIRFL
jgi:hypothetical protein